MVIDPVCSIAFEAETEEEDVMRRPPRAPGSSLFSPALIVWAVVQGVLAFAFVAAILALAVSRGMPHSEIRALVFFALVFAIISLIFVNRSTSASLISALRRPNLVLALVLLAVVAILSLTLSWSVASSLFQFGPLHFDDLALAVGAGMVVLTVLELLKFRFTRQVS